MRPNFIFPLLVALPLTLSACGYNQLNGCRSYCQRPDFSALEQDLNAARARWKAADLQDYRFDLARFMEPGSLPTLRVTVKGGQVAGVEVLTATPPGNPTTLPGATIDELFDELQSGFPATPGKCTGLVLKFAPTDGHPLNASYGPEDEGIQDGGGGFSVSNFTRL